MPIMKVYFEITERRTLEVNVKDESMAEDFLQQRFDARPDELREASMPCEAWLHSVRAYRMEKERGKAEDVEEGLADIGDPGI
jgi:hypothetical protein